MPDAQESVETGAETESAVKPTLAPQPQLAPEQDVADLDVGLDLSLAGAGFPAASRSEQIPRLPATLQARAIGRQQRLQGNFAVQRMLKRVPAQPRRRGQSSLPATRAAAEDDDWLAERIEDATGGGQPIEPQAQARLEAGLLSDLDDVRVHTDADAAEMADAVDAVAFTSGRDIFFGPGTYQPGTGEGLELLAHEAAHTVQQAVGPVAGTPAAGGVLISNPADPFEQAAEKLAEVVTSAPVPAGAVPHRPEAETPAGDSVQREDLPKPDEEELKKPVTVSQPPEAARPKQPEELV